MVYISSRAQGEGPIHARMTYLCSPLTLSILDGIGRGHFQEVENPSHISCGQCPLGRTAVTDGGLFPVRKCLFLLCVASTQGGHPQSSPLCVGGAVGVFAHPRYITWSNPRPLCGFSTPQGPHSQVRSRRLLRPSSNTKTLHDFIT